MDQRSRSLDCC